MDINIIRADKDSNGVWSVSYEYNDAQGTLQFHVQMIPEIAFEYRSAEYGIDHTDVDLLLEILLREGDLDIPAEHPKHLHNADSTDEARSHLLNELDNLRGTGRIQDTPAMKSFKDRLIIDPNRVAVLAESVRLQREQQSVQPPDEPERWSAEQLSAQLSGPSAGVAHVDDVPGAGKD